MSRSEDARSTAGIDDTVDRVVAAIERERQIEQEFAEARRAVRQALVAARAAGATYRALAKRIVPPTGDLRETRRRRDRIEANLRGRLYELRRRLRVGLSDAESTRARRDAACLQEPVLASCSVEVKKTMNTNEPDNRDGFLRKRRIIEEEYVVPGSPDFPDDPGEDIDEAEEAPPRSRPR